MRLFVLISCLTLLLISCNDDKSKNPEWEYRVVPLLGKSTSDFNSCAFMDYMDWEKSLNLCSAGGWELVCTYTTIETVYPNFGDEQYHTGIKENTRTDNIYFVFKRKKKE